MNLRALACVLFLAACNKPQPSGFFQQIPDTSGGGIPGVTVTGTPAANQVLTATDTSTATWAYVDGGAPTGTAGGDLAGTFPSPTVKGLTFGSDARGDVAYRGASAWARLAAGTTGQVLTTKGTGADPAWGTDFGANNLVTTGSISTGTTPAASGAVRLSSASGIFYRNAANSADLQLVATDASNNIGIGSTSATTAAVNASSTVQFSLSGANVQYTSAGFSFSSGQSNPKLTQATLATSSATGNKLSVLAQTCSGTTSTGGDLEIGPGTGTSANGSLRFINIATTTTAPSAGGAGALPATPAGYEQVYINGTLRSRPYY